MTLVPIKGLKIAKSSGSADNSGGGAAADIDVTITFSELENVLYVISAYGGPCNGVVEKSTSDNTVTVTAKSVPAGETATVHVVVVGY